MAVSPENFQAIREEWRLTAETLHKTHENYDKYILTLSTGAIGAVGFLYKDFAEKHPCDFEYIGYLYISVAFFGLALLSILASYFFGMASFRRQLSALSKESLEIPDEPEDDFKTPALFGNMLNYSSGVFFIIGVLFASIFIFSYY